MLFLYILSQYKIKYVHLIFLAGSQLYEAMNALTFATERLKIAQKTFNALQEQEASPTTPGTAKKCILPVKLKNTSKQVFRQLHKNEDGGLYYVTQSEKSLRRQVPVDPTDPRIYSTVAIREEGFHITDGKDIKVHHRDV